MARVRRLDCGLGLSRPRRGKFLDRRGGLAYAVCLGRCACATVEDAARGVSPSGPPLLGEWNAEESSHQGARDGRAKLGQGVGFRLLAPRREAYPENVGRDHVHQAAHQQRRRRIGRQYLAGQLGDVVDIGLRGLEIVRAVLRERPDPRREAATKPSLAPALLLNCFQSVRLESPIAELLVAGKRQAFGVKVALMPIGQGFDRAAELLSQSAPVDGGHCFADVAKARVGVLDARRQAHGRVAVSRAGTLVGPPQPLPLVDPVLARPLSNAGERGQQCVKFTAEQPIRAVPEQRTQRIGRVTG